jgi:hypothetical protein
VSELLNVKLAVAYLELMVLHIIGKRKSLSFCRRGKCITSASPSHSIVDAALIKKNGNYYREICDNKILETRQSPSTVVYVYRAT